MSTKKKKRNHKDLIVDRIKQHHIYGAYVQFLTIAGGRTESLKQFPLDLAVLMKPFNPLVTLFISVLQDEFWGIFREKLNKEIQINE